jgi:Family of unknown function (DUF695)
LPRLAALTQVLAHVRSDGLPEPAYNETLSDFDHAVIHELDAGGAGLTVIVETFAGERTYYAYVANPEHPRSVLAKLRAAFPEHNLRLGGSTDPGWGMWADYRARFRW